MKYILLQSSNDMLVFKIAGLLIVFIVCVFITRAIFSIPEIIKNLKMQNDTLRRIAEKLGVDVTELKDLHNKIQD